MRQADRFSAALVEKPGDTEGLAYQVFRKHAQMGRVFEAAVSRIISFCGGVGKGDK